MKHIRDSISCLCDSKYSFPGNLSIGLIIPPFPKKHFYCHAVTTATNRRQPCDAGLGFLGRKTIRRLNAGFLVRHQPPETVTTDDQKPGIAPTASPKRHGGMAV